MVKRNVNETDGTMEPVSGNDAYKATKQSDGGGGSQSEPAVLSFRVPPLSWQIYAEMPSWARFRQKVNEMGPVPIWSKSAAGAIVGISPKSTCVCEVAKLGRKEIVSLTNHCSSVERSDRMQQVMIMLAN